MCCQDEPIDLPALVQNMLASYRERQAGVRFDWGGEFSPSPSAPDSHLWWHHARFADWWSLINTFVPAMLQGESVSYHDILHRLVAGRPPAGLLLVEIDEDEVRTAGEPAPVLTDGASEVAVLCTSTHAKDVTVGLADEKRSLRPGASELIYVEIEHGSSDVALDVDGCRHVLRLTRDCPFRILTLDADACSRWSVVDRDGFAWFPADTLHKWDAGGKPFFHAGHTQLRVPADRDLVVTTARGLEFNEEVTLVAAGGKPASVAVDLVRDIDPAATGWYGGDLHVHMNYSGDHVVGYDDAARMQRGEGLHLMHLVAANHQTALVYDREVLASHLGEDLPWSTSEHLARVGVEYRNDMLGHFHAFGGTTLPGHFHSGHPRSDNPNDWPANAVVCDELRAGGAVVGYTHPVFSAITNDSPDAAFAMARSNEARELVVDAALGLVDSMDLLGPQPVEGNLILYRHLLNAGLRLAATAGTDTMLSMARVGPLSNPPGWARVYADLQGEPLSAAAFGEAIRAGRTMVTNGPWLTLTVNGQGPGTVLPVRRGDVLTIEVEATSREGGTLAVAGPDGVLGEVDSSGGQSSLTLEVVAAEPLWITGQWRGAPTSSSTYGEAFALSTPVYVEADGEQIKRPESLAWCLRWIDRLEEMIRRHGHFDTDEQRDDVISVLTRARQYFRPS